MKSRRRLFKLTTSIILTCTMIINFISTFSYSVHAEVRTNLALGKAVEASSVEDPVFAASKITDGVTDRGSDITNPGKSRWSSNGLKNGANPQWVVIDLGEIKTFNEVAIEWERNNITSRESLVNIQMEKNLYLEIQQFM